MRQGVFRPARTIAWAGGLLASVLLALPVRIAAAAAPTVVMEQVAQLQGPSTDTMSQPTDVVVARSGEIWVLDGVNRRLARFSSDGRFTRYVSLAPPGAGSDRLTGPPGASATTQPVEGSEPLRRLRLPSRREAVAPIFGPPPPIEQAPDFLPDRPTTVPARPDIEEPAVPLDRLPVALGLDQEGRLLVGDRHRGAIDVRDPEAGTVSRIAIPREPFERPADPTDVIPSPDGRSLLVVDNDNHCLKEVEPTGRLVRRFGRRGPDGKDLSYPATVAAGPGGRVLVVDVLNARVAVFERGGSPLGTIGSRGVTAGTFYRPKGVAVDGESRVHVTDSFTGLVQVFDLEGRLVGVWATAAGEPHRLRSPASIASDGAGRFYVVEMLANRVSVWQERGR